MSIKFKFHDFTIEVYDDENYNPSSADNVHRYTQYYSTDESRQLNVSQHGIKILDEAEEMSNEVCIAAMGGRTRIHSNSCVIQKDTITICCGNTIFSLALPELTLRWKTTADSATCFEIFANKESYIIHGELEISKLTDDGNIVWQFSGGEIFTTPTGKENFKIENDRIYATNWDNVTFELDADSGQLLGYNTSNAKYS